MPPAAATECDRTGWTLLMIATVTPSFAAARAARWPARPAPMIRTSCSGMSRRTLYARRRRQRSPDLPERDHAAQKTLGVDGDHGAEPPQALGAEKGLERR